MTIRPTTVARPVPRVQAARPVVAKAAVAPAQPAAKPGARAAVEPASVSGKTIAKVGVAGVAAAGAGFAGWMGGFYGVIVAADLMGAFPAALVALPYATAALMAAGVGFGAYKLAGHCLK